MKNKSLPLMLGIAMVIALFSANAVVGINTGIVNHHTGDLLVYSTSGGGMNYQHQYSNIDNINTATMDYYGQNMRNDTNTQSGMANVLLVDTTDLSHVPIEWSNVTTDPNWPSDGKLYGLSVEDTGSATGTHEDYNYNFNINEANSPTPSPGFVDGWMNYSSPLQTYGPQDYHSRDFQGAASTGDFALIPFMDNNGGDGNLLNVGEVLFGQNATVDIPQHIDNLFGISIDYNITLTVEYYHVLSQIVKDANGHDMTVDIYHGLATITAQYNFVNLNTTMSDNPNNQLNITLTSTGSQSMSLMYSRATTTNGMFMGFSTEGSYSSNITMSSQKYDFYGQNATLEGNLYWSGSSSQDVLFKDFIPASSTSGSTTGLNAGDQLHYTVHDITDIKVDETKYPNGPQGSSVTNHTSIIVDANSDAWITVINNNATAIGMVMEQQYNSVAITQNPPENGTADVEAQLSHIYLVQVMPLNGHAGILSNAQQDVFIPAETTRWPGISQLFSIFNNNNNNNNNNGENQDILPIIFGQQTGVDLTSHLTRTENSLALHTVNVNGFDYTVVGDNTTYVYSFQKSGDMNVPFDQNVQGKLHYDFNYNYTDSQVFDNATGALLYKNEGTVYTMQLSLSDSVGNDLGGTTIHYDWHNDMTLKEHSVDYQSAQDPNAIPEDPNANTTTSVTTSVEPTNSSEAPGLSLPGFEAPVAVVSIAFVAIYMRKSRYE